ncbi:MAG: 30S ribosomal protein S16 [Flavobacteriales bacterium]|nr:MAG: 30S ribosomal protein S16 [Flavobacteriales bacterium]
MPVRIRLQRHGRKSYAFFHIVAADSRAPRDGRFIEKIGTYNPNTNPATIDLDFEAALRWVQNGAQPSDTCKAILSYKGVLHKNHLLNGAKKGAFTTEEAEKRFQAWMESKHGSIEGKKSGLAEKAAAESAARLEAERKRNEERAAALAAKEAEANAAAAPAEETPEEGETPAEA